MSIPKTKRGGGPKTDVGKASAASNSLKSGTYSSVIVLPGESEQDFQALQDQFVNDFAPEDVVERAMVHELAAITWKKLRLEKLEQSAFIRVIQKTLTIGDLYTEFKIPEKYEPYISLIETLTDEYIAKYKRMLKDIKPLSDDEISQEDFENFPQSYPEIYQEILAQVESHFRVNADAASLKPNVIYELTIDSDYRRNQPFVTFALKKVESTAEDIVWLGGRIDKIKQAIHNVKQKRLLDIMQQQGVIRARDELSRTFYRTLSEFRKQQSWRLKMRLETSTEVKEEKT